MAGGFPPQGMNNFQSLGNGPVRAGMGYGFNPSMFAPQPYRAPMPNSMPSQSAPAQQPAMPPIPPSPFAGLPSISQGVQQAQTVQAQKQQALLDLISPWNHLDSGFGA